MNIKENIKNYIANENRIFEGNSIDVKMSNQVMVKWLLRVGVFSFFILLVISFFEASYATMRGVYLIMMIITIMIEVVYKFYPKIPALFLLYFSYIFLISICIYASSFFTKDLTSVITVIFLVQAPVTILDKSWRILCMELSFTVACIIFIILFKDDILVVDECVNVVTASTLGILLGNHLRNTQLANFELKRQAIIRENTDELTRVGSRKKLFEDLASDKYGDVSAIVMMDVDDFKAYNDTYGHQQGDQCLSQIGAAFLSVSKHYKVTIYRYGGEEFVGIIHEKGEDRIKAVCQAIIDEIFSLKIIHEKALLQYVTLSIGLSLKVNNEYYEQLINDADRALYTAKRKGKNTFCIN